MPYSAAHTVQIVEKLVVLRALPSRHSILSARAALLSQRLLKRSRSHMRVFAASTRASLAARSPSQRPRRRAAAVMASAANVLSAGSAAPTVGTEAKPTFITTATCPYAQRSWIALAEKGVEYEVSGERLWCCVCAENFSRRLPLGANDPSSQHHIQSLTQQTTTNGHQSSTYTIKQSNSPSLSTSRPSPSGSSSTTPTGACRRSPGPTAPARRRACTRCGETRGEPVCGFWWRVFAGGRV